MIKTITTSLLSGALVFLVGLTSVNAVNQKNNLPEIGVVASNAISLDKEVQIGDALMRQLRGQAPLINDPLLEEYIQDIGNRLVAQAENVKFPYKFFMINSLDINAFAFFGGHIGIHSGLIINAKNESELASVLAHEVSHVTQRHIARRIEAQQKSSPLQIASLLGGILLAAVNPEAGMAALSVGNAASAQSTINFTRQNEKEADRVGIHILAQAGFDPNGASSFFGTLTEKNRLKSKPLAFLLTHPLPETRVADARTRAATYRPRNIPPSINFHLAKSRILARYYANPVRNIEYFSGLLKSQEYVFKQAAQYGLALSYLADEQVEKASTLIDELLSKEPDNLFYLDTYTDISVELEKPDLAITKLSKAVVNAPHNPVLTLNLANVLIKNKQADKAIELLKDFLLVKPQNLLAYEILSDAYKASQQNLEMHQTKAEIYALVAAYPRAIDELQTAYTYAKDRQIEKQRIRGRIEQFRSEQEKLQSL
ncbi:M48 family metalloprotease [Paraglaciecola aquimarina]|uniref:Putative beta-barrel assembly-enhancing protease n=1 Tax=Paraglaciecola algarum TaxID=3050085 RepID=A0ABS9D7L3_9ALTE|nr:M48 family metalloprotease [Paraglaciecola sp. G1-23]MCF2948948.1 M48 family metalloprotease [Paraglaciecola sp. G1-23]